MTKYDKILIVCIIFISLFGMFIVKERASNYNKKYVEIIVDGVLDSKYILDDNLDKEIKIETKNGYNTISISNGKVSIIKSNCKNQLCVRKGVIEEAGELIVCLPHRVIVQIIGETSNVDSISY